MEQQRQCNIRGMRNLGVVSEEDRISELPDALLLHILSSLPTETAIVTSVLSKRWKSLWKMMPELKFDSKYHHDSFDSFSENISRSLVLHRAPVLQSFHLSVRYECDAAELGLWIGIAFARNVRELVLSSWPEVQFEGHVKFPSALCRCNSTLEILRLEGSILFDLSSMGVCFNSLRELHLYQVIFKDEDSVFNLLAGCPSLQDLVVDKHCFYDVNYFAIEVPSLQRLTIRDEEGDYAQGHGRYVINAPSLKYLNLTGLKGLEYCLIVNLPELVEAKIDEVYDITNENILESLVSAKCLSLCLSPLEIQYPSGSKIFYQLLSLELHTRAKEWWNLLSLMLERSPKLQILKLIDPQPYLCRKKDRLVRGKWNQPKCVPECLLFHLETFVWTRFEWQREDEKDVATYILKNARHLKKAALSTKPIESEIPEELEKRREMLDQLAAEVRGSSSCHLVIFDSETD